ncbi:hypothetical protein CDD81_4711 [Ophiocordyceps australis]|uniref:SRR1-like domain-containing protein n=1 Tax=Ophiocordyceps australis TaxID=1399860 RepID=A0A2C5YBL4_9HYPO|nr:hypothetical protein CDD81_4711 [Ophiocordyceps australis]
MDGWTRVTRRNKRLPAIPRHVHQPASVLAIDTIAARHARVCAAWQASSACAAVRGLVRGITTQVLSATCLGLGSFEPPDGGWDACHRAHVQLAAFATIIHELEQASQSPIPCFFQDPAFSPSDCAFLASLGYSVLIAPAASAHIDASSFIYAIHLYRPVYADALAAGPPAIFVGTAWPVWDALPPAQPRLDALKTMHDTYHHTTFPQYDDENVFSSTAIYWRPSLSADGLATTLGNVSLA